MNRLSNIGDRFSMKMSMVNGPDFYGQILSLPDTSRVSNFLSARRYLRTNIRTVVSPSNVIIVNGLKYIVAEHGDGFYKEPIYKHFKLFEVDEIKPWYTFEQTTNSLTGLKDGTRDTYQEDVYLSTQPKSSQEDSLKIPNPMKIAVCNAPVEVDDKIGPYLVTKVDVVIGVYVLELKLL